MSGRHASPRALGAGRLATRQFTADPWVSVGLAVLVGLVALLLTAVPRGLTDVQGRQLAQELGGLSAGQRDVIGTWNQTVHVPSTSLMIEDVLGPPPGDGIPDDAAATTAPDEPGPVAEPETDDWAPVREGAERIRAAQPEPLRSALGEAQVLARLQPELTWTPPEESGYWQAMIGVAVDPDLERHVELVEGEWPALVARNDIGLMTDEGGLAEVERVPVLLLRETADALLLEVGDPLTDRLVLAGTYVPSDPEDPRWQHVANAATMGVLYSVDRGESALATAFLSPANRGALGWSPSTNEMSLWFPVDGTRITGSTEQVALLRTQLTGFLAQEHVLVTPDEVFDLPGDVRPTFRSELAPTLDRVAGQQRAMASLLAVVVAGPLGVGLAVAALGARLVVHRRRPALAMTLARGASPTQLRRLIALEGLALGIPAALLGHLVAMILVPGPTPWWQWVVTAAVALVPSVALAASLDDASLLQQRSDLSGRSRSRWRWVVEAAVLALAAVATWRLLDRGARGDDATESGIDLLVAATPVLLALAACVVALRLYPLPLAALTSALRARPGLTPFLGAARSLRDPAGGLVPALAVVLGTTVALVSAVLLSTVTRGAEVAAWEGNGAALRVTGPPLTEDLRAELAAVDGVAAVAGIADSGQTGTLSVDGDGAGARVWVADHSLQQVLAATPGVAGPPDSLFRADGLPAVVTLRGTTVPADAEEVTVTRLGEVEVVGHLAELPGSAVSAGVLVDKDRWVAAGGKESFARTILLAVQDGADVAAVGEQVQAVIGERGVLTSVAERLERFEDAPVTDGLRRMFVGATVVAGLLTVLAVVVVQLMGSTARARLLSLLRTLGLAPGQTRALTAWELAPLLLTSLVVGALLGLAVPWVLLRGLDLTGLTGGATQPDLVLDPALIALVLGAVVLTVAAAVVTSAWVAGRTNLAQALRVGEER